MINPERIVVGGDLAAADGTARATREALERSAILSAARDVEVVRGTLGQRAEVLGAVALVLRLRLVAARARGGPDVKSSQREEECTP